MHHQSHWPISDTSRLLCCVFTLSCALGQVQLGQAQTTSINLATQSHNADFSTFSFTRPVSVGTTLPTTCQVGQLFFLSTANPGANLLGCTASNTWAALSANSINTPQIALAPASLAFANQNLGTISAAKTITLTNVGSSFLSVSSITTTGGNAADFAVSNNCGTTVPSGGACTISITFQPTQAAVETTTVAINGNEPGSPVTLAVTGTGAVAITSGGLVITPSAATAGENGTVTLTANRPVNWSLATGSSGNLTATSTTIASYSAPATIPAQNVMGGCQVTPNDSVFNTRIDSLPVESHSATWTANMGSAGVSFSTAWGMNIADSTTPVRSMSFYYTVPYNGPFVMPQWPTLKREGGEFGTRLNGSDHHIMTVRKDNCQFYEIYNDWFTPGLCHAGGTTICNAQSGLTYAWNSYALPSAGSTDAAGLPLSPLMLNLAEIKSGAVKHAFRFTLSGGYIQAKPYWPANSGNGCSTCTTSPPYGARFRLKASFDISTFSPAAQVVLTALKQYGMFLADAGAGPTVSVNTDISEDGATLNALYQIGGAKINMTNFEAVDESSFIVGNGSLRVNPSNGFQTPAAFAVVTATDQSNASYQVNYRLALQSVIVGLPSPTMTTVAGMSGYQLTSWVNGSTNQNVNWSVASGVGSVTPGGVYTPPATLSSPAQATLQVASVADPTAISKLYVTVLPIGTNPAGSIRIDAGNGGGTTDGGGNVWFGDQAFETGDYVQSAGDYPNWTSLNGSTERSVYQSSGHTYGSDLVYNLVVPNGNYKVRVMLAQPYNGCPGVCPTFNPNWHAPLHIEANGQIALHNFDFGLPIAYAYATPYDVFIPAQVVNNTLSIALRANLPDIPTTNSPSPILSGLEIMPDTTAPHLVIDTQQQTKVAAGNTLQLYSVGWYMSSAVTWSITGPGSISQGGLYTAPATAPSSAQLVTITAVSLASSGVQATATLTIPASGS